VRQRDARNAEAVAALLNQCEEALRAGDAAKAAVALEAARKRFAEGGAEEQAQRLGRLEADLTLSRDLDTVDQFRWTTDENKLPDATAVATRTRDALRRFGADPESVSVDDAGARVSASVVRERIVSALDWLLRHMKTTGVRALLRRVDGEAYRDAVRDAYLGDDTAKRISELAGQQAALEQPPGFVAFLGQSGAISVDRRRQLLQAAVTRRSWDLGLLITLGNTYPIDQEDGANERLRWFQAAVAAAPANAVAHIKLGLALHDKGQFDAAIDCHRKAIELDPKYALAHGNLGNALSNKGQLDAAIACFKKAIELDPTLAAVHGHLGNAMWAKGQLDEAIACYKRVIKLDPKDARSHRNLGLALAREGQWDEAIAEYKKAIELDPKSAAARTQLVKAEQMVAARNKLPAFQNGTYTPASNDERLGLAECCQIKKLNHTAAGLYAAAFAADPKLAADLGAGHRYNAACSASLAAAGQGEDAAKLDDKERTRLRQQALDWLKADLTAWANRLDSGPPQARPAIVKTLRHWQQDPDLAGLRDPASLAKLPAEERKAFTQLWADVAALLEKADEKPK
jgi:tetratricopeptide (TPR) repeat protein